MAFHYVTVEVMRLYVICLQTRRSDRAALSLATCAATLINRGRMMTPAITTTKPPSSTCSSRDETIRHDKEKA